MTNETQKVRTREDLARFLREMADDLRSHGSEWENSDLESFIDAAAAWIDDMDGFYQNRGEQVPDRPDWSTIANIFAAAKVYE